MSRRPTCRCHCRACGSHFSSLMAFDAHREGSYDSKRVCSFPDDADLVERTGDCDVSGSSRLTDVTVYYAAEGEVLRELREGRETASPDLRGDA